MSDVFDRKNLNEREEEELKSATFNLLTMVLHLEDYCDDLCFVKSFFTKAYSIRIQIHLVVSEITPYFL